MASKPVPLPLAGFNRLNRSAYILQPPSTNIPGISTTSIRLDPGLILLCTWLDAAPKHIAKYTSGYRRLYPTSTILLLTTGLVDATLAPPSSRARRIKPVLDILTTLPSETTVLLHLFSNGGAFTTCLLAKAYRAQKGRPLPISALVLDSSPGKPEHFRTHTALATGLPRSPRLVYFCLSFALHLFLLVYRLVKTVTWQEDLITKSRRELNDTMYVGKGVPRLYVYSDADLMVRDVDVRAHAEEAAKEGYKVSTERWEGSGHCGHLMKDEGRYWKAVRGLWDDRKRQM